MATLLSQSRDELRAWVAAATRPSPPLGAPDRWLMLAAAAVAFALAFDECRFRHFLPQGVHDEYAYLLQARTLLRGRLSLPPPALPEFFEAPQILVEPRYMSKYPPAHAALLAPFVAIGAPWLWACVAFGATAALLYRLLRGASISRPAAAAGVLVFALSGHNLRYFTSLLAHSTSTLLAVGALVALQRLEARRDLSSAAIAGGLAGAALLTRPFTAIAILLSAAAIAAVRRLPLATLLAGALPVLIAAGLAAGYSRATLGSWTTSPWAVWAQQYTPFDGPGFGPISTAQPTRRVPPHLETLAQRYRKTRVGHTLDRLPLKAERRAVELAGYLPSLLLLPLAIFGAAAAIAGGPLLAALLYGLGLFALNLTFHASLLQYHLDEFPALACLAAGGLDLLGKAFSKAPGRAPSGRVLQLSLAALGGLHLAFYTLLFDVSVWPAIPVVLLTVGLLVTLPTSIGRGPGFSRAALGAYAVLATSYALPAAWSQVPWVTPLAHPCPEAIRGPGARVADERCVTARLDAFEQVRRAVGANGLLFVRYPADHFVDFEVANARLDLGSPGEAIVAIDRGADDARLLAAFPGRPGYVLDAAQWTVAPVPPPAGASK